MLHGHGPTQSSPKTPSVECIWSSYLKGVAYCLCPQPTGGSSSGKPPCLSPAELVGPSPVPVHLHRTPIALRGGLLHLCAFNKMQMPQPCFSPGNPGTGRHSLRRGSQLQGLSLCSYYLEAPDYELLESRHHVSVSSNPQGTRSSART